MALASAEELYGEPVFLFIVTRPRRQHHRTSECAMPWTSPILVEICIGLEINGYLPAEF
jgi:hypothetical protein